MKECSRTCTSVPLVLPLILSVSLFIGLGQIQEACSFCQPVETCVSACRVDGQLCPHAAWLVAGHWKRSASHHTAARMCPEARHCRPLSRRARKACRCLWNGCWLTSALQAVSVLPATALQTQVFLALLSDSRASTISIAFGHNPHNTLVLHVLQTQAPA